MTQHLALRVRPLLHPRRLSAALLAAAGLLLAAGVAGCGPSDPLAEVRRLQAAGNFQGSLEPLRKLLAERPDDAEVQYRYGTALAATGQPSLAEWSLRKAMENPEWLVPAAQLLADDALRTQNYNSAIEYCDRILEAEPDDVLALLKRANARAHGRVDLEKALADVDRIFELDPKNAAAMEPRVLALLGLERYEEAGEAIDELDRMVEENDLGPEIEGWACATRAIFADDSDEIERAREIWAECLEHYPAHANVVTNAVKFFDREGEYDRSREIVSRALDEVATTDPASHGYRVALAERLRAVGKADEGDALLAAGTESENPQVALMAWVDLGKYRNAAGDFKGGSEAIQAGLDLAEEYGDPDPQLLLELADALLLAGDFDRALEVANRMKVPAHQELIRARVAQQRGRPADALAHYDEVFRLWPNNPQARYLAALAAEAKGDFDRAVEEYRYSIRIDPAASDARTRLARMLVAEHKPRDAFQVLQTLSDRVPLVPWGRILAVRLWAEVGDLQRLRQWIPKLLRGSSREFRGRVLAAYAEGIRARAGAAAAVSALLGTKLVDLHDPGQADALRALVRLSHEAGEPERAEAIVEAALQEHAEAAALHEVRGLALELRGAPREAVREAYARAVELDAQNAGALWGLGRLALDRDPQEARALFDRAAAADPSNPAPRLAAARAVVAAGEVGDAEERLEAILAEHPYEAGAASELASLQLAGGNPTQQTLALARRAVRFGGGADALELLSRVYEQLGEPDSAAAAAARARALREKTASRAASGA